MGDKDLASDARLLNSRFWRGDEASSLREALLQEASLGNPSREDVDFAIELARLVECASPSPSLVRMLLDLLIGEREGAGAIRVKPVHSEGLKRMERTSGLVEILPCSDGCLVGFQRHFVSESRIGKAVLRRCEHRCGLVEEERPVLGDLGASRVLSSEQEIAVRRAMSRRLCVISGGPGTGKTSILVALLRTLVAAGISLGDVALTAPTGKGAHRMEESVRRSLTQLGERGGEYEVLTPARTLHRLLGFSPESETFRHHEGFPLDCRMCIVDESSMVDNTLFEKLLAALPDDASLVLLGDADQLPSVEVGAVFRELSFAPALVDVTCHLRESFRMRPDEAGSGRNILSVSEAIRRGDCEKLLDGGGSGSWEDDRKVTLRRDVASLRWRGVEQLVPGTVREEERLFLAWLDRSALAPRQESSDKPDLLFEGLESERILCFTRVGKRGSEAVNAMLHELYCRRFGYSAASAFAPGEPVMMTRNDYTREIFNGDMGVVVDRRDASGQPIRVVAFKRQGGNPLIYPLSQLENHLELAFALTTHKSQGSEFGGVLLILPSEGGSASRELLYTAVTRARRSVVIAGEPSVLAGAIQTTAGRASFLSGLLGAV